MRQNMGRRFFLSGVLTSFIGCASPQFFRQGRGRFVGGVDGFMDVILDNDLHKLGEDINRNYGVGVCVNSIGCENATLNRMRYAHAQGRKISGMFFSMGCEKGYEIARTFEQERIPMESMIWFDPTFTNDREAVIPENVGNMFVGFSTGSLDPMAWARGNEKNILVGSSTEYASKEYAENHCDFVNWGTVGEDVMSALGIRNI